MTSRKFLNVIVSLMVLTTLLLGGNTRATAMPMSPTDETKVPHYFGPYPNWANSQFTLPDVQVVITGNGSGAEAVATVGANGAITDITITNPGHDYSSAKVDILPLSPTGTGSGATADVTIVKKGAVVEVMVVSPGSGYTAPVVTFSDGTAAATAYGGVEDNIQITNGGGFGYQMPTVDFDLPDGPNGVQAHGHAVIDASGAITDIVVDSPGSGYSTAPNLVVRDGTLFDPINHDPGTFEAATFSQPTLAIQSIVLDAFGADYKVPPTVTIDDTTGNGTGANATAVLDNGVISAITLKKPGSGYLTPGIRKFVDTLPMLCDPSVPGSCDAVANTLGQYLPVAVPDKTTFPNTDYYEIAVVQHREQMHSDLSPTLLREYVQISTGVVQGKQVALYNDMLDGSQQLIAGHTGVDDPHFLGPVIVAQKDRAVRITFYNLLPTGVAGDLFMPTDTYIMGSGEANHMHPYDPMPVPGGDVMDEVRNPMCTDKTMRADCFTDNRATLHLHGGNTPWISDGTPHQWITPANEQTAWPQGVSVGSVPDMVGVPGVPDCSGPNDGCSTFYYTNQQSARLMFYHDHAWGITRLNVYAGEAAGYLIQDPTEQALVANVTIPADQIPLVIQDRTFVPDTAQMAWQDPTWDYSRWGGMGNLWYHHVYMPAQNPGDPGGMSAFGRWMYGPWFWPPAGDVKYGPIENPYYGKDPEGPDGIRGTADDWTTLLAVPCNLDDPATWQYDTDPFCEPPLIPGTPNISAGMEQFNDTPIVNGTAYPTVTLEAKSYRFRILNAANDRFFNFQWYVADPTTASTGLNSLGEVIGGTEVALNAAEVAAAQLDPVVFPTPDLSLSPAGPDWIQIGTEGGFLPKPVVVDGQQFTTWITDPTRFDVGNVDQHSLLIAPAERADVIVDFSKFAGQTLILYNDAPAAFPARIPSYDYYTGAPDLSPVGAPTILPGYGPNTRTIMQVKIAGAPAPAFNLSQLQSAFSHKADGSGVFESGQPPIIVGQAAYNPAYGTNFASGGWCNSPTNPSAKCDGFARISEQGGDLFKFDTLRGTKVSVKIEPKAIHDETNASAFDEFGRMQANLGVEVVPATPGLQNVVLHPFVFPMTEIVDTSNLPLAAQWNSSTNQYEDIKVTPIASGDDGSQIWKITHNGVDTHPIHFHAYDVQLLNRVTWDNIIIPPDPNELGWKDTVRISPLEDTIVALRPIVPLLPFDFPNSVRLISPMMAEDQAIDLSSVKDGLGLGMSAFAPTGDPIDVYNHYVNFGAEYVYHCHILSHEEMDMMRPVVLAYPPVAPSGLAFNDLTGTLSWTDNSLSETAFVIEKSSDGGVSWTAVDRVDRVLTDPNGTGPESITPIVGQAGDQFRIVAQNTVGDTWDYSDPNLNEILPGTFAFPVITTEAVSEVLVVTTTPVEPPAAPSGLTATPGAGPQISLAWVDNAGNEDGFLIQRSTDGVTFSDLVTLPAGSVSYNDTAVQAGFTYTYQVAAYNAGGYSAFSSPPASATIPGPQPPAAPSALTATLGAGPQISLAWVDNAGNEDGFLIQRSTDGVTFSDLVTLPAGSVSYNDTAVQAGFTYTYQVAAFNLGGLSAFSNTASVTIPGPQPPAAPSELVANLQDVPLIDLAWVDNSLDETGFVIERSTDGVNFSSLITFTVPNVTAYNDLAVFGGYTYTYRVAAFNTGGPSGFVVSNSVSVPPDATPPAAPSNLNVTNLTQTTLTLNWQDNSNNEAGFTIQIATNSNFTKNLVTINNVGPDTSFYNITGLKAKTQYFFRVLAFNANFTSPWSPVLNVTTPK